MIQAIYVIPFDKKYFLLGICLLHNFRKLSVDCSLIFVPDFGLTVDQINFLNAFGVTVLKPPTHLVGTHPYKQKANLAYFLAKNGLLGRYIIFLDADMILLKNPESELRKIIQAMSTNNKKIAVCEELEPTETLGEFVKVHDFHCSRFARFVAGKWEAKPYLNIGFTIFAPTFDFNKFQQYADQMEGEVCWEQNAINIMCIEDETILYMLDSKVWNVHAKLLNTYALSDEPFILHLTSSDAESLVEGVMVFGVGENKVEFFYRSFKNQFIVNHQMETLKKLADESGDLFLKCGTPTHV